jgi:hydrogenase maturation protease
MLLIGYGNPLRTDDGVGQVVAENLSRDSSLAALETISCHQLLPEHAEAISQADRVVFVDAEAGPEPGCITVRAIEPDAAGSAGLIHDFAPQTLVAYAQLLYGHAPPATLVTVSGYSFEHGEELSQEMTAILPDLLAQVRSQL